MLRCARLLHDFLVHAAPRPPGWRAAVGVHATCGSVCVADLTLAQAADEAHRALASLPCVHVNLAPLCAPHLWQIALRVIQRVCRWEDRVLTFQLCLLLALASLLLGTLGALGMLMLPLACVLEWAMRLLGFGILGPHMYWVGKRYRRAKAERLAAAREFDLADNATRRQILAAHREQLRTAALARLDKVVRAAGLELADTNSSVAPYVPLLVQPRPAAKAGTLRFRHQYEPERSRAYPIQTADSGIRPSAPHEPADLSC